MNQLSHDAFTRGAKQVRSPVSRRRTHRLLRLGLICGAFAVAAAALLVVAMGV
jgi:hypothetical protein